MLTAGHGCTLQQLDSHPIEHIAIITPVLTPMMLISSVICATHAGCSDIKPPENRPKRAQKVIIDDSAVIPYRHMRMIPVQVEVKTVVLNLAVTYQQSIGHS
jgi:hypothetical protein